jgi:hypothetical protein
MSYRFWWDELNIEHIADHGVEPYEAEEVLDDDAFIVRPAEIDMLLMVSLIADAICSSSLPRNQISVSG